MRLADYTDYALRVLMYCAAHPDRLVTIAELAEQHGVSKNHLMKIVNDLARQGVLETARGRGGGLRLLKAPADIRVGDVVRSSETDFRLVECFDSRTNACSLTPSCRLKGVFHAALQAYLKELDSATLADIVGPVSPVHGTGTPSRRARTIVPISAPANRRRLPAKHDA
jgi:Rrf2 family transcriptional regulator, nitric oxide-sensitive transcriptional repressor